MKQLQDLKRVHNRFGGMRDLANFCGDIRDRWELKTGARCGNFDYERERDFVFSRSRDARIAREKQRDTGVI